MGFHTGKHGKVYNDDKKSKGSKSDSPGNHDGSSSTYRDDDKDDVNSNKIKKCNLCHGSGRRTVKVSGSGGNSRFRNEPCIRCFGSGALQEMNKSDS